MANICNDDDDDNGDDVDNDDEVDNDDDGVDLLLLSECAAEYLIWKFIIAS